MSCWIRSFEMTPLATDDQILVKVMKGLRSERHVVNTREILRPLAPLPMLGDRNAMKTAENCR